LSEPPPFDDQAARRVEKENSHGAKRPVAVLFFQALPFFVHQEVRGCDQASPAEDA
jgi:hypothetical protein